MKARVRVVSLRYFDHVVSSLSPRAFRVYAMAMQWSCYHATDGVLTPDDIETIGAKPAQLEELFKRRLLEFDDQGRTVLGELTRGPFVAEVEGREVEHRELSPGAIRQRLWRQRKRNTETSRETVSETQGETPRDVTAETLETSRHVSGGPTGGSDSGSSPDPESYSALTSSSEDLTGSARDSGKRAKRQVKRHYPLSFPLPEELELLLKYGREKGLRDGQIREQIEALELWAKGSGALKLDWMATAKGWLRRYAAGDGFGGNGNGRPAAPPPAPYHAPIDTRPREPGLAPADALQAIAKAKAAVLGRTMP